MDIDINFDVDSENSDEEFMEYLNNLRPYVVRERVDNMNAWSDSEFLQRFRLTKRSVQQILQNIEHNLVHKTNRNNAVSPLQQLLLTLRFYATGSFYANVGDLAGVSKSVSGKIIPRVTRALISLRNTFIHMPETREEIEETQADFYQIARFPRVVGAIDGTQVRIQSPGGQNAEIFRNRKGYFSLNVQVVGNAKYFINDIVARWPGSAHDSNIFDNSRVRARFENGEFGRSFLIGDSGYPLRNYVMTPRTNPINPAEHLYNESQIRTRTIIERIFGIWKRRFPVLTVGLRCKVELAQEIILATAILHNIGRKEKEPEFIEILEENGDNEDNFNQPHINNNDNNVQVELINYFQQLL